VLGDLAAHGVDLARYVLGEIDALTADSAIFLAERARPTGATAGHQRDSIADGTPHGTTLDDAVRSAEALDAMAESARTGTWVSLPR
jgi:predicted dehydrogenase